VLLRKALKFSTEKRFKRGLEESGVISFIERFPFFDKTYQESKIYLGLMESPRFILD
jgi:hypothetical protein